MRRQIVTADDVAGLQGRPRLRARIFLEDSPSTAQGPSIATDHARGYARFAEKHPLLPGLPFLSGHSDILTLLFTGDDCFYSDSPAYAEHLSMAEIETIS